MMSERVREVEIELYARQNEAIRLLSEANYELVSILKMHVPYGELSPVMEKVERAGKALEEAGGFEGGEI